MLIIICAGLSKLFIIVVYSNCDLSVRAALDNDGSCIYILLYVHCYYWRANLRLYYISLFYLSCWNLRYKSFWWVRDDGSERWIVNFYTYWNFSDCKIEVWSLLYCSLFAQSVLVLWSECVSHTFVDDKDVSDWAYFIY